MAITTEQLDLLLSTFKDTLDEFKRSQRENTTFQREMMDLLKENLSIKMETQPSGNGELPPKLPLEGSRFPQNMDHSIDEQNRSMFNPMRSPPTRRMKPKHPTVKDQLDGIGWDIFIDAWTRYKKIAELNGEEDICMELREACSEDVNQHLYQFIGAHEPN